MLWRLARPVKRKGPRNLYFTRRRRAGKGALWPKPSDVLIPRRGLAERQLDPEANAFRRIIQA